MTTLNFGQTINNISMDQAAILATQAISYRKANTWRDVLALYS